MDTFPKYRNSTRILAAYKADMAAAALSNAASVIRSDIEAAVMDGPRVRMRSTAWMLCAHRDDVEALVFQKRFDLIPPEFYCLVAEITGPSQPEEVETLEVHFGTRHT